MSEETERRMKQLEAFVNWERVVVNPEKTHIAEWALGRIKLLEQLLEKEDG